MAKGSSSAGTCIRSQAQLRHFLCAQMELQQLLHNQTADLKQQVEDLKEELAEHDIRPAQDLSTEIISNSELQQTVEEVIEQCSLN